MNTKIVIGIIFCIPSSSLFVSGAVVATTGPGALIAVPLLTIGCAAGGALTGAEIGGVAGSIKGIAKD